MSGYFHFITNWHWWGGLYYCETMFLEDVEGLADWVNREYFLSPSLLSNFGNKGLVLEQNLNYPQLPTNSVNHSQFHWSSANITWEDENSSLTTSLLSSSTNVLMSTVLRIIWSSAFSSCFLSCISDSSVSNSNSNTNSNSSI